jgi:hypothetical protein
MLIFKMQNKYRISSKLQIIYAIKFCYLKNLFIILQFIINKLNAHFIFILTLYAIYKC